jgi:competence protein ComEA
MRIAALFVLSAAAALAQNAAVLPDGPGKAVVERLCASCHAIENVIEARRTKLGWQRMVEDMVGRGAEGSEEEFKTVVDYLTAHYGKINVNTASAKDLETTLSLATREAEAIVSYREKNGRIKDFPELRKIPGVNAETLDAKRPLIVFAL